MPATQLGLFVFRGQFDLISEVSVAPTPEEIDAKAAELLDQPKAVTSDGMSQTNLTPADLVTLDKRNARKASSRFGFAMRPMKPPEH